MKKVLSIVFAMLILVSGMHLSVATHFCGGEIAAVKWSVTGEKGTCGMEKPQTKCPIHDVFTSNCCQDEVSICTVDTNYSPSTFQFKKAAAHLLQVFSIPVSFSLNSFTPTSTLYTSISPRDKLQISAVNLEHICVFRI